MHTHAHEPASAHKCGEGQRPPPRTCPQVTWDAPMREDPCVAVIGGGLSGLVCGQVGGRSIG